MSVDANQHICAVTYEFNVYMWKSFIIKEKNRKLKNIP